MNKDQVKELFSAFDSMTALVIGDVMIDAYYKGKVDRISPEAPVPVVHVKESERRLGGAANVARNLKALGATPILCATIGNDLMGREFMNLLGEEQMPQDGILELDSRMTTVKTRIISGSQHMLRIDEEEIKPLTSEERRSFVDHIRSITNTNSIDVIIFEDYDKGQIDAETITQVVELAREKNIPVSVDPKKDNFLNYREVDLFKPNLKELVEGLKIDVNASDSNDLINADKELKSKLNHKTSLITLSEHGVFVRTGDHAENYPAHLRKIADVSGAGDTVISVASLCLAKGLDQKWVAQFSNLAGGLVCEKVGVVPIDKQNLLDECLALCNE